MELKFIGDRSGIILGTIITPSGKLPAKMTKCAKITKIALVFLHFRNDPYLFS